MLCNISVGPSTSTPYTRENISCLLQKIISDGKQPATYRLTSTLRNKFAGLASAPLQGTRRSPRTNPLRCWQRSILSMKRVRVCASIYRDALTAIRVWAPIHACRWSGRFVRKPVSLRLFRAAHRSMNRIESNRIQKATEVKRLDVVEAKT